jgi:NAD(P)-dependent dehydrogenase (short-subunit alcohol dehydrogenase family)
MRRKQIALVTGAGRGIGRSVSLALAREGVALALVARTEPELRRVAAMAGRRGSPEAVPIPADVTSPDDVRRLMQEARRRWKRLDVLVNNAGTATFAPLEETEPEAWEQTLRLNLTAPYLVLREAVPLLEAAGSAHVFQMVSAAGRRAFPNCAAYCASKFGLMGLTEVVRQELRGRGIKVTAVLPGAVGTGLWDGIPGDWDRPKMLRPDDVAHAVVSAWKEPATSFTEEIVLGPVGGDL